MQLRVFPPLLIQLLLMWTFTASSFKRHGFMARSSRLLMTMSVPSVPSSVLSKHGIRRSENLKTVRKLMALQGLDAMIIPTDDPHMSEYTAEYFGRREFISGFTGSAGTVIITMDSSVLFTDGRYHKQAENELDAEWTLMKQGIKDVPSPAEYLVQTLPAGAVVGIDPLVHAAGTFKGIERKLKTEKQLLVKAIPPGSHPIDAVWGDARPAKPNSLLRQHPLEYAGKTSLQKQTEIRSVLQQKQAHALVVTSLDEIAWLFNFRSSDVPCNPVSVCYAMLTTDEAYLFIDREKINTEMAAYFAESGVSLLPYEDAVSFVQQTGKKGRIWFDGKSVNMALYHSIEEENRIDEESPIVDLKACKNAAELSGMRACHLRDAAAVVEFMSWLDEQMEALTSSVSTDATAIDSSSAVSISSGITEVFIDEKVTEFRQLTSPGEFIERSFPTIAGANDNGAIMHYRAEPGSCKVLSNCDLLLLDSGAQYIDGTTDVTRTFHTGTPTDYQKEMFTRVLKGNIALDSKVFPAGTPGCQLDAAARQFLWEIGKNYLHGTGHGVGAALNVHEGPQRISPVLDSHPLKPGMVVSNEPGYYENGNFGIRIENLLEVVPLPELGEYGGRGFLGFRKLTLIPIQQRMISVELMTDEELRWLNEYHGEIQERVGPLLLSQRAKQWLEEATKPLTR